MAWTVQQKIDAQLKLHKSNLKMFEDDLKDFNRVMTASAICQEIGIQAAFAAATMGAATWLSGTRAATAAGGRLVMLGGEGSRISGFMHGVAKVAGFSSMGAEGWTAGKAMGGFLARLSAGFGVLLIRRMSGDFGMKKPMNFEGMGSAVFFTVLFSFLGSPGPKNPPGVKDASKWLMEKFAHFDKSPVLKMLAKAPELASVAGQTTKISAQTGTQIFGLCQKGYNELTMDPVGKEVLAYLRTNKSEYDKRVQDIFNDQGEALVTWGLGAQHHIAKEIERKAEQVDYSAKLPFFARHFDFVGNAEALKIMSTNAAKSQAFVNLWEAIRDTLNKDAAPSFQNAKDLVR
ncbi:hypothetical protein CHH27_22905 [Labrenzia sp. VG12]|nr:hypothetical protein CHH27_22905 [Labrenzia sp. VG12]